TRNGPASPGVRRQCLAWPPYFLVKYGLRGTRTLAFGVTGFAALRLEPQPQVFQALSLGARGPVPPAPPYGTPNQNLVPVQKTGDPSVPANLSVAAQGAFSAI